MLIVVFITCILLLVYLIKKSSTLGVGRLINSAVAKTEFASTYFVIGDRSTKTECNRLITVKPFGWMLWALNDELYLLEPENGPPCSDSMTPAIRILGDRFLESCLTAPIKTIQLMYSSSYGALLKHVPYTISGKTFTVLSAINILAKRWLTFAPKYLVKLQNRRKRDTRELSYHGEMGSGQNQGYETNSKSDEVSSINKSSGSYSHTVTNFSSELALGLKTTTHKECSGGEDTLVDHEHIGDGMSLRRPRSSQESRRKPKPIIELSKSPLLLSRVSDVEDYGKLSSRIMKQVSILG